jgi:glucan phosphorylase
MFGLANTKVGSERLAYRLMWAYARMVAEPQRPVDRKVNVAVLDAMCKAANAVGYGHTESHVSMVVTEVMRDRPQPAFNATNSSARIEWEKAATAALTHELDGIL